MKHLFVPATSYTSFSFNQINTKQLPQTIGLVSTVQFLPLLSRLKPFLEKHGKKAIIHGNGQILGCNLFNATNIQHQVQCFLYIGSGKFHPLMIALNLKQPKPIFLFNPITQEFLRLNENDIAKVLTRKKTAKIKFLGAKTLGILVSTKPGQEKLQKAEKLKEDLVKQGKKAYIFISDNLDINQLENFPQVEAWVNATCPGISIEYPFIWIDEIYDAAAGN